MKLKFKYRSFQYGKVAFQFVYITSVTVSAFSNTVYSGYCELRSKQYTTMRETCKPSNEAVVFTYFLFLTALHAVYNHGSPVHLRRNNDNSTQLNKPPRKVAHKRKEAHKSLIISPILKITVKSLFKR